MSFDNESKFWTAITKKDLATAFSLLYAGVNPNTVHESTGSTPMHVACREGDCALAMLLFTKGAEINAQDKSGQTPLHLAAAGGHGQIVVFLIKAGADVTVQDKTHQLAEELAFHHNHTTVFRMLLNARLAKKEPVSPGGSGSSGSGSSSGGDATLRKSLEKQEREQKKLEKEERKLVEKDGTLKHQLLELSVEKTRLEAIPAHLVTKKEKAMLAQVERQLSKLDIKHQKYVKDIKEVRRTSFEAHDDKGQAWLNFLQ